MESKYIDSYGLPGTFAYNNILDMGDSAAIYFNILALSDADESKASVYFSNAPIRHPDTSKWYGQPDRFSRDQLIPLLCWAILKSKHGHSLVKAVFKSHLKKGLLLAWNTRGNGKVDMPEKLPDITGPEVWGLWLRIFKPIGYKALLPLCDLETLVNSILWKSRPETNQITRNHMLVSLAQKSNPSVISDISYNINDFNDLTNRWQRNVEAVGEYPATVDLFKQAFTIRNV